MDGGSGSVLVPVWRRAHRRQRKVDGGSNALVLMRCGAVNKWMWEEEEEEREEWRKNSKKIVLSKKKGLKVVWSDHHSH